MSDKEFVFTYVIPIMIGLMILIPLLGFTANKIKKSLNKKNIKKVVNKFTKYANNKINS
jgi:hypothetical protein